MSPHVSTEVAGESTVGLTSRGLVRTRALIGEVERLEG